MNRQMYVAVAALALTASCSGGSTGAASQALRAELEAAHAEVSTAEAERDRLAAQVAELQQQVDELSAQTEQETPTSTVPTPETTAAPTTTAPPPTSTGAPTSEPAALDASPFVVAFGDIGVVSLPPGDPGVLAIVASGTALDRSGSIPVIVRNNTANTIGQIDVAGIARDASGALAGSGSSQGFQPARVEPGEIAWGYVYFGDAAGQGLTFDLTATGEAPGTYFLPVEITELNVTAEQVIGVLANNLDVGVSGPISVDGVCFAADGTLLGTIGSYAEQDDLPVGGIGSFSIDLFGDACPIGLVAGSGYEA